METRKAGDILGDPEILKCDHCRIKKLCERIVYNNAGNVIFICKECKARCS